MEVPNRQLLMHFGLGGSIGLERKICFCICVECREEHQQYGILWNSDIVGLGREIVFTEGN